MVITKKITYAGKDRGKWSRYPQLVRMGFSAATMEISVEGPHENGNQLPYYPAVPFLGVLLRNQVSIQ
jgi:hypothetical protein